MQSKNGSDSPQDCRESFVRRGGWLDTSKIGMKMGGTLSTDGMECETYEDWARQAERQNPDTIFTKELMDAAFRKAISRVNPNGLGRKGGVSGVLTRVSVWCLSESTRRS